MALTDNLVSYWKFDESSGTADDAVGSNDLTIGGSATYTASGKINNSASLPGSNDYFVKTSHSGLTPTGDFTFACWIYPTSLPGEDAQWIIAWANTTNGFYFPTYYPAGQSLGFRFKFYNGGSGSTGGLFPYALSTNTWYHVAFTFLSSTKALKNYVNGSQNGATQTDALSGMSADTAEFSIGRSGSTQPGRVDEFGVWSRELSSSEISELYNGGAGLAYPFTPATSIKTVNGLAKASVKTVNGLAIASVKTINGLA